MLKGLYRTGDPEALDVHLSLVERDVLIDGSQVKIHCHCLTVDGNGRVCLSIGVRLGPPIGIQKGPL
ncbi:hypothetical protein BST63_02145 [Bradyrhizobium canariense]|uniref:Uncharacterized protein n=1 Tax=Bradyrhizobium canariense TaxID=255045 RepID=A0ABX3XBF1_9BRAD|nr:hypothetical protein BSR47_02460 [Bradyrhizobium canariense]OSJ35288.1 hypothetical protein BST63_02145 [Bradyrhizobium canariense]